MKRVVKATRTLWLLAFVFGIPFLNPLSILAIDYTNANFILRNPAITISGGRSTAPSFEFYSSTGQTAPGESTNTSFTYQAGFLYFGSATAPPPPPPSPGGNKYTGANVTFSGKAYPNATVVLLKDAQIAATVVADSDANFTVKVENLSPGDYLFSIYAKDYNQKASRLIPLPVKGVSTTDTTISDILIPPTLSKDKQEVKRGETINFFGQTIPSAVLTIVDANGNFSRTTHSSQDGKYTYGLVTSPLNFGEYVVFSKVSFKETTAESAQVNFKVGDKTITEEFQACPGKADLNHDCAVNLVDFSILIYWFDKPNVPAEVDLDPNGAADLVDFSIMAYYWTG